MIRVSLLNLSPPHTLVTTAGYPSKRINDLTLLPAVASHTPQPASLPFFLPRNSLPPAMDDLSTGSESDYSNSSVIVLQP
jgi:hypothetical protein